MSKNSDLDRAAQMIADARVTAGRLPHFTEMMSREVKVMAISFHVVSGGVGKGA
jgi:hypothetical protein